SHNPHLAFPFPITTSHPPSKHSLSYIQYHQNDGQSVLQPPALSPASSRISRILYRSRCSASTTVQHVSAIASTVRLPAWDPWMFRSRSSVCVPVMASSIRPVILD